MTDWIDRNVARPNSCYNTKYCASASARKWQLRLLRLFQHEATLSQRWPRDAPNIWVPWKLYVRVSAKSADDCARISTLQSYRYIIRRWNYFRSIPTNVITVPKHYRRTDRQYTVASSRSKNRETKYRRYYRYRRYFKLKIRVYYRFKKLISTH